MEPTGFNLLPILIWLGNNVYASDFASSQPPYLQLRSKCNKVPDLFIFFPSESILISNNFVRTYFIQLQKPLRSLIRSLPFLHTHTHTHTHTHMFLYIHVWLFWEVLDRVLFVILELYMVKETTSKERVKTPLQRLLFTRMVNVHTSIYVRWPTVLRAIRRLPFQNLLLRGVEEGATLLSWLLHLPLTHTL